MRHAREYRVGHDCGFCQTPAVVRIAAIGLCARHRDLAYAIRDGTPDTRVTPLRKRTMLRTFRARVIDCVCVRCGAPFRYVYTNGKKRSHCAACSPIRRQG